ncbi:MAG: hypothetical protein KTR30_36510 [Saprospiraceae bacterium]|nr:hypothetical protein [Saprospiraceae bacterium]
MLILRSIFRSLEVDARELWLSDEKGMEAKAKKNWKQIRDYAFHPHTVQ